MSFILSKILWPMLTPIHVVIMLLVAALGLQALGGPRWRGRGLALSVAMVTVLVVITLMPVGAWVMLPLESRFPRPVLPERVDGVIVLGGSVNPSATAAWGRPTTNHAADRMIEFAALARRYPHARLVFTGGSGSLSRPDLSEAPVARAVFELLGAPVERMQFESESRNTFENAVFTRDLVKPKPGETWVLITSAYHMPRSVGIFNKIGWPVLPDPVAYYTGENAGSQFGPAFTDNLHLADDALHEWAGLIAYHLMGRTDRWLPGPG